MQISDNNLCCICFDQACTIEVQDCGHQMCAQCTLALCCHSKPNPTTASLTAPVCPFCCSSIAQLVVVKAKTENDIGLDIFSSKLRRSRKSRTFSEGSSSFKGLSAVGSFGRIGARGSGRIAAENENSTPITNLQSCVLSPLDIRSTPQTRSDAASASEQQQTATNRVRFTIGLNQHKLIGSTDQGTVAPPMFISSPPLKTARKWPSDGAILLLLWSHSGPHLFCPLGRERNTKFWTCRFSCYLKFSGLLALADLLERCTMLETPIKLPSVMLLSWKKDPVD
ncbi:hypothetical protein Acr_00g0007460 [Actinidia rufa]|uniref:RING-type E3 ubiquitin transferase n=1 Tax=Actinidia rufa TaxID=165716 RepID=A0A7J0D8C7_9ERIC|nr:hypothetical protein Acr_00g0007460 [Actinidia rufa]